MASWLARMIMLAGAAAALEIAKALTEGAEKPDINGAVPPPQRNPVPEPPVQQNRADQVQEPSVRQTVSGPAAADPALTSLPAETQHVQKWVAHDPVAPEDFARRTDVFVPEEAHFPAANVEQITLTVQEAIAAGWRFEKKSRHRARIRRYTGKETDITVPAQIGDCTVNELGRQFLRQRQDIQTVRIPKTVNKLASGVFEASGLRECIFAPGVLHLPARAFADCRQLRHVQLPYNLQTIGTDAFFRCYMLKTIHIPRFFETAHDNAFRRSGLESFTVSKDRPWFSRFGILKNGAAIPDTPLASKYNIVCAGPFSGKARLYLKIKPGLYRFPEGITYIFPHALPDKGVLDLQDSRNVRIDPCAAPMPDYGRITSDLTLILPPGLLDNSREADTRSRIPAHLQIEYPDGRLYPAGMEMQNAADGSETILFRRSLGPDSIKQAGAETLMQASGSGRLTVCARAVADMKLKTVLFRRILPEGKIFMPWCSSLHTVRWIEDGCEIVKYIPSAKIIGELQHSILLEAFRPREDGVFFDEKHIEKLFRSDFYSLPGGNVTRNIRISQRTKILTAIDILRGTHRPCDPPLAVYAEYLIGHVRYAGILMKKYPEYAVDFVNYMTLYDIEKERIDWHFPTNPENEA